MLDGPRPRAARKRPLSVHTTRRPPRVPGSAQKLSPKIYVELVVGQEVFGQHADGRDLSPSSSFGAKSKNRVSEIQCLTDCQTLEKPLCDRTLMLPGSTKTHENRISRQPAEVAALLRVIDVLQTAPCLLLMLRWRGAPSACMGSSPVHGFWVSSAMLERAYRVSAKGKATPLLMRSVASSPKSCTKCPR